MGQVGPADRRGYPIRYSLRPHEARKIGDIVEKNGGLTPTEVKGLARENNVATKVVVEILERRGFSMLEERPAAPAVDVQEKLAPTKVEAPKKPKLSFESKDKREDSDLAQQFEDLTRQRKEIQSDRATLQMERADFRRDVARLEKERSQVEAMRLEAEMIMEADDGDISGLTEALREATAARIEAQALVASLKEQLAEVQTYSAQAIPSFEDDLPESMMVY